MKAEQILDLDCTKEENREKLARFLCKVKPLKKKMDKEEIEEGEIQPVELLEEVYHGICIRYGYFNQGIRVYYENQKFVFYNVAVLRTEEKVNTWIGTVYGKTLWETVAKMIVKVYDDIMKERKCKNE